MSRLDGFLILVTISLWSNSTHGQFEFRRQETTVIIQGQELLNPWAGGLNSIQYNSLDLDGDGIADLVLFDRSTNILSTYLRTNDTYVYAPNYQTLFPDDLTGWVLLRDYDCDGLNDIFTNSQQGMRVFKNLGTAPISWELVVDPVRTLGTQNINLFFNATDIPIIDDIDGDGDLDVLAFNFATGENIDYHQNQSIENTGACGLDFVRLTRNFGGISECECGDFTFNAPCPVNGRVLHAGGKSLLYIDLDGDGDSELITGEETCLELTVLENLGDDNNPVFNNSQDFFTNNPSGIQLPFPSAYNVDLNSDNIFDLAISSNLRNGEQGIDFASSSLFYENTGTNSNQNYELISTNFLQNEMIDVGENAYPSVFDIDRDGDQDLLIGSGKTKIDGNLRGTIHLFENSGTIAEPVFSLITNDFMSISELGLTDVKPYLLDMNTDDQVDLVFFGTDINLQTTNLYYIPNKVNTFFEFDISELQVLSDDPILSEHALLTDIDKDGLVDLLVGRTIGTLEYHRNINTNLAPEYDQVEGLDFLKINSSIDRINIVPTLFDADRNGSMDLITTDGSGELTIYQDIFDGTPVANRNIFINPFLDSPTTSDLGRISWPLMTDLYNTGSNDLLIGTISGGLYLFQDTTFITPVSTENVTLDIFPNPASGRPVILRSSSNGSIELFNISGKSIIQKTSVIANQPFVFESTLYPEGVYIARFNSARGRSLSKRFVITR